MIVFLLAIVASCYAETCPYAVEQCPNIAPKDPVDFKRLDGTWLVQYHSMNFGCSCPTLTYRHEGDDPKALKLILKAIINNGAYFEEELDVLVNESCSNPKGFYMEFLPGINTLGKSVFPGPLDFFVLDTDYVTYNLLYGCNVIGGTRMEFLCYHTREGTEPPSVDKFRQILKDQGVLKSTSEERGDLIVNARQNCPE